MFSVSIKFSMVAFIKYPKEFDYMSLFDTDPGVNNSFPIDGKGCFDSSKYLQDLAAEILALPTPLIDQVSNALADAISPIGSRYSFAAMEVRLLLPSIWFAIMPRV